MSVSANEELLTRFYESFAKLDADAMANCYHEDIRFSDPVFPDLQGASAAGMWRMLCETAADFELSFSDIEADEHRGTAHWDARYTFSATGRRVYNCIDASFEFKDGLISRHTDVFSFWRWSRMALGPIGFAIGWTPLLKAKVRHQAASKLSAFLSA